MTVGALAAIEFAIPKMRLVNGTNDRESWYVRARRAKSQRTEAFVRGIAAGLRRMRAAGYEVTITRIGPRRLDDDGATASAKHVRDGIADALGLDDGDARIAWRVEQRKSAPREYGVEVRVEVRP